MVFTLFLEEGYELTNINYENYDLKYASEDKNIEITLNSVQYSLVIEIEVSESTDCIFYDANGGNRLDGLSSDDPIVKPVVRSHLRLNTSTGTKLFERENYALLGWNTKADYSGTYVGLGSRISIDSCNYLYAQWEKNTDISHFDYSISNNKVLIDGYHGTDEKIIIPKYIEGYLVTRINENSFVDCEFKTIVIPDSITIINSNSFVNCEVETIYISDNITSITDNSFLNCDNLTTLHINAVYSPKYSGTYFDTFQDKYDYLLSIKDEKKIVIEAGSSARFGFDSSQLDLEFENFNISNMGVYAYSTSLPQMELILPLMKEGDILLHTPEFDARERQFCYNKNLDEGFFCMMESNYDTLAKIDLKNYTNIFSSLQTYLSNRLSLNDRCYELSPSQFTEEGDMIEIDSYNKYGDYVYYRENSDSIDPVYGLLVNYTISAFPESYINSINDVYLKFQNNNIKTYFSYAPRNIYALSEESDKNTRKILDDYLSSNLISPVISDIESSLYEGTYMYKTDNHLSTEGAQIRTKLIIDDLIIQMDKDEVI